MFDIVFVGNNQEQYNQLKKRVLVAKKADNVQKAQQISLTNFVWIVFDDIEIEKVSEEKTRRRKSRHFK